VARPRALILSLKQDNAEMEELLFSLGYDIIGTVIQNRGRPDTMYYLGSGKVQEVKERVEALDIDKVVVNAELKPPQIFKLVQALTEGRDKRRDKPLEVYDRIRVILEIFRERAKSQEARLQVELAQLRYEMPIVKEAIHLEKKGEHAARFFGGGAYETNDYFDMMKSRMAKIREELDRLGRERGVRRKHRRRGGFHLVSLAGYTNAGKSSLLRAMAEDDALAENRYFSTLSTRTRRAKRSAKREILVTDTVGFIEDLPPWIVDAFHSTLEEIALADVILLVLDGNDPLPEMRRRLRTSLTILWDYQKPKGRARAASSPLETLAPLICVINKVDLVDPEELAVKLETLQLEGSLPANTVRISARNGDGIEELFDRIYALLPDYDGYDIRIPHGPEGEAFVAFAHERTDVLLVEREETIHVRLEARTARREEIEERLRQAPGAEWSRRSLLELEVPTSTGTGSVGATDAPEGS